MADAARAAAMAAKAEAEPAYATASQSYSSGCDAQDEAISAWDQRKAVIQAASPAHYASCLESLNNSADALETADAKAALAASHLNAGDDLVDEGDALPANPEMAKVAKYDGAKAQYQAAKTDSGACSSACATSTNALTAAWAILNQYG